MDIPENPKITIASSDGIDAHPTAVQRVLDVIAEVCDLPGARDAFVSDQSSVWDFMDTDPDVASHHRRKIAAQLGLSDVRSDDLILDLAKRVS